MPTAAFSFASRSSSAASSWATTALVLSSQDPKQPAKKDADDWQPEPGFRSLFNGKDLTGWCFRAKADKKSPVRAIVEKFDGKTESSDAGRYSARDGILTVNFPKGQERLVAQLYTVEEFPRDFILKLEFRASVNADSGIFIRKPQLQCR